MGSGSPASSELSSGEDVRELVKFAAYLGRLDEMPSEQAYSEVYGDG